jgi:hypothetical protein
MSPETTLCPVCTQPLDGVAKAARSPICTPCAWEAGELEHIMEPPKQREAA